MTVRTVKVPLYGTTITLVTTPASWNRCAARLDISPVEASEGYDGVSALPDHGNGLLGVFRPSVGILAHEATHMAASILNRAGIDPFSNNEEPLCYLVQWIVDRLWPIISRPVP